MGVKNIVEGVTPPFVSRSKNQKHLLVLFSTLGSVRRYIYDLVSVLTSKLDCIDR